MPEVSASYFLTVLVPVFNERATVHKLLDAVVDIECDKQVIVIDDGSTDGTTEILQDYSEDHDIILLNHEHNRGKGAAIRTGLRRATGELSIVQDADLEYDPREYAKLTKPIVAGVADVVFGSRRLGQKTPWRRRVTPFYHGVSLLNTLVWLWYGQKLTDEATCYKLFRTEDLRRMELECERFEFCPEVTGKACRLGLRIEEIPISYTPRKMSEGKKIGFKDAVEAAMTLWKFRSWKPTVKSESFQPVPDFIEEEASNSVA